ncbi:MAG: CPBP family intramembrane metalloprotease, partial [Eubacteriales bacterium]|nr:CPBP family intramembrane metalloprotease [Eubacteriales bacterium]
GVESIMAEIMTRTDSPKILVWGAVLYIPIVNAAAEEIFFRGFILQRLAMRFGFIPASLMSAGFFAVYHLIVFRNWFNPLLLALALSGLVIAGLILNWLAWHCRSLLTSWTVHGLMNIAVFIVACPYFK